jgi:hypothetical protein
VHVRIHVPGIGFYAFEGRPDYAFLRGVRRTGGTLQLRSLARLFRQSLEIGPLNGNWITIRLAIPEAWIYNSNSVWSDEGQFRLWQHGNTLFGFERGGSAGLLFEKKASAK